jgi:hypothetical protein
MTTLEGFVRLAQEFETRARQRAEETPADPAAAALAFAARKLRETIAETDTGDIWWTTDRAAAECDCSVAAVQYWCRHAERLQLRVIQKPSREYLIHRDDALRRKPLRVA